MDGDGGRGGALGGSAAALPNIPLKVNRIIDNSGPAFSHPRYIEQARQFYDKDYGGNLLRDFIG